MLLAIDIGNTNINVGLFKGRRLVRVCSVPTKQKDYRLVLRKILAGKPIEDSVICSVVPKVSVPLARDLKALTGKRAHIIGKDLRVPIKNLYRKPDEVGQDRLVNAYAGVILYGAPLISIDFGTAITFDVISRRGEYLGGMVLPGLKISLEALFERTALLPKISLSAPKEFIGRDTKNSMLSGIVYGYAALTDDLVNRIKSKIGRGAKVIGTGGNISLIGKYCRRIDKIDRDLTLKGVNFAYKNLLKNS